MKNLWMHSVKLDRKVETGVDEVFNAFTNPAILGRWFTKSAEIDLRVGGRYCTADRDKGEYLVVERPLRLRFTWENEGHCPGTVVEVALRAVREGTEITLEHSRIKDRGGLEDMRMGWSWALDSLKSYLETGEPIPFDEWKKTWK